MGSGVRATVLDIAGAPRSAAGEAVREVLGATTGRAPEDIQIRHGRNGKPAVLDGPHFSMSQRNGVCVVVTSDAHPVGVDLERVPDRLPTPLLELVLPPAARRAVLAADEAERPRQFALWWCRMTAAVRACGAGLDEAAACLSAAPQRVGLLRSDLAVAVAAVDDRPLEVEWTEMVRTGCAQEGRRR